MRDFLNFLIWFALDGADPSRPTGYVPTRPWNVLAFAVLSAIAFTIVVIADFSVFMVRRSGYSASGAGSLGIMHSVKTLWIIAYGALGAFLVAVLAAAVDLFQINSQTAVITGVTWQIAYAKLLTRFTETMKAAPDAAVKISPAETQTPTEEK